MLMWDWYCWVYYLLLPEIDNSLGIASRTRSIRGAPHCNIGHSRKLLGYLQNRSRIFRYWFVQQYLNRSDRKIEGGGYTTNAGANWTSMWTTYEGGPFGRPLKNPRGPITPAKFSNGNYLLVFFNNNPVSDWIGRNPYWLTGGRFVYK